MTKTRIRLTKKIANVVNDVDLTPFEVGNVIELEAREAEMMITSGWAERVTSRTAVTPRPFVQPRPPAL